MSLIEILIAVLILLMLLGGVIILLMNKFFYIKPTLNVVASPPLLNDQSRQTVVIVEMVLPKPNNGAVTVTGNLYEADTLGDDHLQTFTLNVPAGTTRVETRFMLTATNVGNEERLTGNTSDYSSAEDLWQIYAETKTSGRIKEAKSNIFDLPWTN